MENKFTTEIFTLEKLAERRFIIPSYQRPYVWGEEQINKLIDNFYDVFRNKNDNYYVGTVLLSKQKIGENSFYQLIDGQQRFTTLWLIAVSFKILQKKSELENFLKIGDKLRIDFAIRKQIKSYMLSLLERTNDKNQYSDTDIEQDEYMANIAKAVTTIIGKIKTLDNLPDFGNFIFTNVHFVINTVPEKTDLNKLFATINNSGIQLEQSDILKSLLLKKIITEKNLYSRIWGACENMNNYFERNVKQLFPQEFDWTTIQYDDLEKFEDFITANHEKIGEELGNGNALTIADILQKDNKCNLKIDLRKGTSIKNFSLSEINNVAGKFFGTWIGQDEIDAENTFFYRVNEDKVKIQLQFFSEDKYAKGIELEMAQNGQDIEIQILWAKASKRRGEKNRNLLGKDWSNEESFENIPIAYNENDDGYGISEIIINPETENNTDNANLTKDNKNEDDNIYCRSIIKFPQLLLHAYRIFLKQQGEDDFDLPFHSDKLLQIFKPLTEEKENTIKAFFKCLWKVRFMFDKHIVKWRQLEDDKDEVLLLTTISKSENTFARTNKAEPCEISMLQSMLYFTGNYNTQIWLTPYLNHLINGKDSLSCLESIDNKLSLSLMSDKETTFALMDKDLTKEKIFDFESYLRESKGTSFRHYWFQKLEYILWKEFSKDDKRKNNLKFKNYRITSKNSVEHIFPQHHKFEKEIEETSLNSFGNLALLNVSQNSSYSNKSVLEKQAEFKEKPTFDSLKLALIYEKDTLSYDENTIKEHRDEMINKIKQHYGY
ncbi:MAG: DUF262 domain-containing HNH endonuclease family protein [Prevotella sp.]|jgi:uncharacterized protein with ParB-like and HNH nuclease domain|nr:DUF262 domain-containing HNH endonuclease family protein [Prevotella sp.]